jgi:hypothetical protein
MVLVKARVNAGIRFEFHHRGRPRSRRRVLAERAVDR